MGEDAIRARGIESAWAASSGARVLERVVGVWSFKIMRIQFSALLAFTTLIAVAAPLAAQEPSAAPAPKPQDTEVWEPVPPIVTPGATNAAPPSDAIVLFDGKNLDEWVTNRDKSPAKWVVSDGVFTVNKAKDAG